MSFELTSKDIHDGQRLPQTHVFNAMGHQGANLSPHLARHGEPAGTKSFVITMFDPDAPTGSGWWHWTIANIPAQVHELAQGAGTANTALPLGATHGRTDFGSACYGGAAPPAGPPHRYIFTVYAIDTDRLDLDEQSSGALVGFLVHFHSLGKATLTTSYGI
ncbi:MAG: kinase inhibitor [Steroidobacteraceae bacterium]